MMVKHFCGRIKNILFLAAQLKLCCKIDIRKKKILVIFWKLSMSFIDLKFIRVKRREFSDI